MQPQLVVSLIEGRFKQHPPADILQSELDYAISIRNRIAALTEKVELFEADLLARRRAGARVEPGPHIANLKREIRGRRCTEKLVIK